MRALHWVRGHILTLFTCAILIASVTYVAFVEKDRGDERRERREQVNKLACAIQVDGRASLVAIQARAGRGIPGDDLLATNKTRLVIAASELNPDCLIPKELR